MTERFWDRWRGDTPSLEARHEEHEAPADGAELGRGGKRAGHRWMMIACCIPMVIVVIALLVSGVAGPGAIVFAVACIVMMVAMMAMMPGGHG